MSRKFNTKHPDRGRKVKRMFGKLAEIEGRQGLRLRQERRVEATGFPWPTAASAKAEANPSAENLLRNIFEGGETE